MLSLTVTSLLRRELLDFVFPSRLFITVEMSRELTQTAMNRFISDLQYDEEYTGRSGWNIENKLPQVAGQCSTASLGLCFVFLRLQITAVMLFCAHEWFNLTLNVTLCEINKLSVTCWKSEG